MAEAAGRAEPPRPAPGLAWPAAAPGRPDAPCLPRTDWLSSPPKMAPFTRRRVLGACGPGLQAGWQEERRPRGQARGRLGAPGSAGWGAWPGSGSGPLWCAEGRLGARAARSSPQKQA